MEPLGDRLHISVDRGNFGTPRLPVPGSFHLRCNEGNHCPGKGSRSPNPFLLPVSVLSSAYTHIYIRR